jgi:hypothetical protein
MSLKENFRVVRKMGDTETIHDRSATSPGVEIEWDYSKSRLRWRTFKPGCKPRSAKDMKDLAKKLKQGCDDSGMDKCLSPNLRSQPYKQTAMRSVRPQGRIRKAEQARERLRTLALQLESVDSTDQIGFDKDELQALCEGMDREIWESDTEGMDDVERQVSCNDGGRWERSEDRPRTVVMKDSPCSATLRTQVKAIKTLRTQRAHHEPCGSNLRPSVAKHQPEIR